MIGDQLHSYSSIYAIGHKAAADLFDGPCVVEEKIDGSQFSFGVDAAGELHCRSKGTAIVLGAPEQMFGIAVNAARALAPTLTPGWVYRAEYLQKPKHNTLAYARVPSRNLILFDIDTGGQTYLPVAERLAEADRVGLEVVPVIYEGIITSAEQIQALLDVVCTESCLGGCQPEGLVIKNYARFGPDKKTLMGKYVREAFKEQHRGAWKTSNPGRRDVIQQIIETYKTDARWQKAVQHLRERGALTDSPKDIGALLKEVAQGVRAECADGIKDALWHYAWPQIQRGITSGLPQWYKDRLLAAAFENAPGEV